jgi:hypothetical protein
MRCLIRRSLDRPRGVFKPRQLFGEYQFYAGGSAGAFVVAGDEILHFCFELGPRGAIRCDPIAASLCHISAVLVDAYVEDEFVHRGRVRFGGVSIKANAVHGWNRMLRLLRASFGPLTNIGIQ